MMRNIVIGVLAVALIGTGMWGFREQEEKNTVMMQSENNYQRAFHDLTYQIDLLHDEIGATLAMNSKERLSPSLADVWRITSEAQNELGQLPLGLMPFTKTEEFLYKVGNFSYRHAIRDLDQDPLTEENYDDLKQLYSQAGEIQKELRKVQSMVLRENLRWTDVELDLAAQDEPLNNAVVNGFHIIDEKVGGFSEVNFDNETNKVTGNDEDIEKNIKNEDQINENEAIDKAREFLNQDSLGDVQITETGKGLAYEAYSLVISDGEHGTNITMDITKKGGHPVWMLNEREVQQEKISLNEASEKAEDFLERNGYDNMQLVESKQYENIGVFQFVKLDDDVRIYTDEIVVDVALDEGDIAGFESFAYLANNKQDRETELEISKEEAQERLNPNLNVKEHHVAVIENQLEEEVLCHEFYGTIDNDTYRIFINAKNGREEQVEKLDNPEPVYQ
ncbi:germination protein YpeB [Salipaludibacillus aurantiacus]|uniref:Spore germination protein n=1 Tax=Salipaludibacillus aurantiacus TaxID=1601833 RepID=A0A1H9PB46_9BACI|nr:germination protein YpeB [Salipaludibacillus aurantiacus]SER45009.1 spore germination protein [Salipaludibacillus aurantiacus]